MKRELKTVCITLLMSVIFSTTLTAQYQSTMPIRKGFIIQSAMNYKKNMGGCWDIPGKPISSSNGQNISVWDYDLGPDRRFYINPSSKSGYFEISTFRFGDKCRVDLKEGTSGMRKNGVNAHLWQNHNGQTQNYRFKHLGGGRFKIYNAAGYILCLSGRKNSNGTNVHLWQNHSGAWTEWYLLDVSTRKPYIPTVAAKKSVKTYPSQPEFFTKRIDGIFKITSSTLVGSTSGYYKIVETYPHSNGTVTIILSGSREGIVDGKAVNNFRTFKLIYNYKSGTYTQRIGDYSMTGKVSADKSRLSLNGEQSGIEITVAEKFGTPKYAPTPLFFERNKDSELVISQSNMSDEIGIVGTAKVKSVDASRVVLSTTYPAQLGEPARTEEVTLIYKSGTYISMFDDSKHMKFNLKPLIGYYYLYSDSDGVKLLLSPDRYKSISKYVTISVK